MPYLLSPDVTDPSAPVNIINPEDGSVVEVVTGGIEFATIETKDGISRLLTTEGKQIEQYPGIHAGFSYVDGRGVYGRCDVEGALVAFKTRREDPAFVYTIKRIP
jgi:hypothetical protein